MGELKANNALHDRNQENNKEYQAQAQAQHNFKM